MSAEFFVHTQSILTSFLTFKKVSALTSKFIKKASFEVRGVHSMSALTSTQSIVWIGVLLLLPDYYFYSNSFLNLI